MRTKGRKPGRKAVSTIIAAIFILATLLAFLIAFTLIMQQMATTTSNVIRANQLLLKKQQERLTINTITITGNSVTITVTNDGTQPIILVSYIIRNNTVKIIGKITPEKYVAPQTKTTLTITTPQTLSPAATYEITLISKLGNAFKATYPIPTTNATTLPGTQATLANTYLPRTAGPGTVTWAGTALIPTPQTRAGNVYTYTALTGTATGTTTNLNYADSQNITTTSTLSYIIQRVKRTAIFYDDFQNNPFTDGNLTIINGTWIWNPTGHYIEQKGSSSTGEFIAIINRDLSTLYSTSAIFVLVKMNATSLVTSYSEPDIILYGSNGFYALGAESNSIATRLRYAKILLYYLGSWSELSYSTIFPGINPNTWFWTMVFRTPSGAMNVTVYDLTWAKRGSTVTTDTSISLGQVGLGTFNVTASFDDVVVTVNATPLYVNFTSIPPGFNEVLIYNSTGSLISDVAPVVSGFAYVRVYQPIIREGKVVLYNSITGNTLSFLAPIIVGGDVYEFVQKYVSSLEVRTRVDLSGTVGVSGSRVASTGIGLALQSNSSTTDFDMYAYDWVSGVFVNVFNGTFAVHLNVTGLRGSFVNPVNGSVVLRLFTYDDSAFTLQVDCLNAFPAVWVPLYQDVLVVGDGGTNYVDVFRLSGATSGSVVLSYWESLSVAGTLFNGSADIVYDGYVTYSLLMVNGSGVYKLDLLNPSASPVLITSACRATGAGVRAEVVHSASSGKTYLVILPGVGNQSFCVYNLTAYPSGGAWLIGFASRGLNVSSPYTVSAVVGTSVYTILQNVTSKAAVLVAVNPFTNSTFVPPSNTANFMPGLNNVGLAYDGKYLWLMLEGGSLYRISPTYANFTNVPVLLLPAPIGYGDRMEYYNGALILVRDSGSSEIWIIPTS